MRDFFEFHILLEILVEVAIALVPLLFIFLIYQIFFFKLPKSEVLNISKGILMTFIGLVLFLYGVQIGFMPAGTLIGEALASLSYNWILIPIGLVLGFVVTIAEPAVRVLGVEVEKASSGFIKEKTILFTLAIGVALSIALSMIRTIYGIPLAYFLIPGYAVVLLLSFFTDSTFTAIAFDSGGVATGPMTVTFILAISVGAANIIEGRNPIIDGFGLIALVALAPILSVTILGLLYKLREKSNKD